ncbi:hypothetical protein SPRG_10229 [Saprolegnia parasitica CBS 223.65]|uniref:Biotin-protein ligase N-terminal domain-containing protein n=1 Tax=Saprolegnia parasitica (strain CBS 223.65) TaxID=695850 RepID=A0A067C6F0_SAPPC|nr:hypothetical protein SPRG_10229 [Saprolegnia parasitica CBS 223.65]KDO24695.1 hypothetical protein SPRG_10229 [Saprolegnia parasitica CBS 223.65]|eukprot:XP_012204575.1 hypothetical protein SPRG_10229 [Saprolegnia parasitica CBS 223.65]
MAALAIVFLNPKNEVPECSYDAAAMLRRAGIPDVRVMSMEAIPKALAVADPATTLYVQPGGGDDVDTSFATFFANNRKLRPSVQRFVADGGVYLGICLGAYAAGVEQFDLVHDKDHDPFFSFDELDDDEARIVPVEFNSARYMTYHQGGPDLTPMLDVGAERFGAYVGRRTAPIGVILRYWRSPRGTIGLLSPHFEATDEWDDAEHGRRAGDCSVPALAFLSQLAAAASRHRDAATCDGAKPLCL